MAAASSSDFDLATLFPEKSLTLKGQPFSVKSLAGKIVAFYFSASWCGPCKVFTPQLISAYKAAQEAKIPFEVIFISSDQDLEEFEGYYEKMPWAAVSYEDTAENEEFRTNLKALCQCEGIPQVTVLEPKAGVPADKLQFTLITHSGRNQLAKDKEKIIATWYEENKINSAAAAAPAKEEAKKAGFTTDEAF